jgi:dCMP deaminase
MNIPPQQYTRPAWSQYFLNLAKVVSTRATCNRAHVGAILVMRNRILTTGYNGSPPGEPHCTDPGVGCDLVDNHCQRTLHAEVNAIAQAAQLGISVKGASMYIYINNLDGISRNNKPCRECMKVLNATGIGTIMSISSGTTG